MVQKSNANSPFEEAASHWLELFDRNLAQDTVPLSERPLRSALLFIKSNAILDVRGGTIENFQEQEWFAFLVREIKRWYVNRYGLQAMQTQKTMLSGIVLLHATPFKVSIPLTINQVQTEGEKSWMIYPKEIHPSEKLKSFFPDKPNLESLQSSEFERIQTDISNVVLWTRCIHRSLIFVSSLNEEFTDLSKGTWNHFEKAVTDILSLREERASVAIWEMHLAMEKCLKVLLAQSGNPTRGHNLNSLKEIARKSSCLKSDVEFGDFPSWEPVNKYRYSELASSTHQAYGYYVIALKAAYAITRNIKASFDNENIAFLLKKPMWV